jgi:sugar lactone lactonase YvrE
MPTLETEGIEMSTRRFGRAGSAAVALGVAVLTVVAGASPADAKSNGDHDGAREGEIRVLLTDLSSPKGVDFFHGSVLIGQGAFGPPGPVLELHRRGPDRGTVDELTDPVGLVDLAAAEDGSGWGIGSQDGVLYRRAIDGTISAVLNLHEYQASDPDPYDQDDFPEESNPYGLAVLPNGDALVADAAGNDIVRVAPDGSATTIARFDLETIKTDHLPPDFGLPPEITAEAVPTTVALGPDGHIYVGLLNGFPFRPGASRVWRIDPDAEGALCSVNTPDEDCTVYAEGFTAIQDIAFDPNDGTLYVLELAEDGVFAFEAGFETGEFPPAVLLEVEKDGDREELARGELSQPGGIDVARNGNLFVTDGVFTSGRLLRIHD